MKTTFAHSFLVLTMGLMILLGPAARAYSAPPFHDTLEPYGDWISWQGGVTVWQPDVVHYTPDWRPYYHEGHWVWNGSAWQWQSQYSWGSVVFHYGHWWQAPQLGWVWVPGTVYAPAWVQWRYDGGTWGWAPMPPPPTVQTHLSAGFQLSFGRGVSISFGLTPSHYVFVPVTAFGTPNLTSIGFYGSSGRVAFSATRTVSCGPSPFSVGTSYTTLSHTSVHVHPAPHRHRSVGHPAPRTPTRHPAPRTPTRHPAPSPSRQTMAGAVIGSFRGHTGTTQAPVPSRSGERFSGRAPSSPTGSPRRQRPSGSRNPTIDQSRNVTIDRSRNVTVQRPPSSAESRSRRNPGRGDRSAAGSVMRSAGRPPVASAPPARASSTPPSSSGPRGISQRQSPQPSGSATRQAPVPAQHRSVAPPSRSAPPESAVALDAMRQRSGLAGAAARSARR